MKVTWCRLEAEGEAVEAQLFEPLGGSRILILFCPGFPGAGATVFEQRHAAALVEEGYSLAVLRHAGTRLDGPAAPAMINHAGRLRQGRVRGESHIGGGPSTLTTWLHEPLTALHALGDFYDEIIVIGNSFGALSALWSLTAPGAPLGPIRRLILLAGAQGFSAGVPGDTLRIWKPAFIAMPRIVERVSLGDPAVEAAVIKDVYERLPGRIQHALPPSIALTCLVVARDELLTLEDTERFRETIGERGRVVLDQTCRAWPEHGFLAHDMVDYTTESLMGLFS